MKIKQYETIWLLDYVGCGRIQIASVILLTVMTSMLSSSFTEVGNKCTKCDESKCPELQYCEGDAVKDHCSCCTVCSSSKFQPHPLVTASSRQGLWAEFSSISIIMLKFCVFVSFLTRVLVLSIKIYADML